MEGGWCVYLSFKAHSTLASVRMTWPTDFRLLHQLAARLSVSQSVSPVSQSVSPVRGVLTLWSSHDAPSHNLPASLPPRSQPPPPPSPYPLAAGPKVQNLSTCCQPRLFFTARSAAHGPANVSPISGRPTSVQSLAGRVGLQQTPCTATLRILLLLQLLAR